MQPLRAVAFGLKGRMDKRLPIAIVVQLACVQDDREGASELTYTENVSAHGVCVVSKRPWHCGELAKVTSFREQIGLRGKVVHCHKFAAERYYVGLTFQGQEVTWSTFRSYATS